MWHRNHAPAYASALAIRRAVDFGGIPRGASRFQLEWMLDEHQRRGTALLRAGLDPDAPVVAMHRCWSHTIFDLLQTKAKERAT